MSDRETGLDRSPPPPRHDRGEVQPVIYSLANREVTDHSTNPTVINCSDTHIHTHTNAHLAHIQKQTTTTQSIQSNNPCCAVRIDATVLYKWKFGLRVLRRRLQKKTHLFWRWHHWDSEPHTVRASYDYGDQPRASRASSDLDPRHGHRE